MLEIWTGLQNRIENINMVCILLDGGVLDASWEVDPYYEGGESGKPEQNSPHIGDIPRGMLLWTKNQLSETIQRKDVNQVGYIAAEGFQL